MAWVMDTCLLIDIAEDDPTFAKAGAALLNRNSADGLVICPISYIELSPVFAGQSEGLAEFLKLAGIQWPTEWTTSDTQAAFRAWHQYVIQKRTGASPKRPIADVLIGACALRYQGLLTRNEQDFRKLFPLLQIVLP